MWYICDTKYIIMDAAIERKQTSFRLSVDLLQRLRIAARRENRSLNNFE